jgi:hypothetical protein
MLISIRNRNYKIRKTLSEKSFFTLSGIKASPHKSHLMFRGVRRLVGILRMNSSETTKKYFQFDNDYFLAEIIQCLTNLMNNIILLNRNFYIDYFNINVINLSWSDEVKSRFKNGDYH